MRIKRFCFKFFPLFMAATVAAITLVLLGGTRGYMEGLAAGIDPAATSGFSSHGPNFFVFVGEKYFFISIVCFLFILGKIIRERMTSASLCLMSAVGIILLYWRLLAFKTDIGDTAVISYQSLLQTSILLDYLCLSTMIILLSIEVVGLVVRENDYVSPGG